MKFKKSLAKVKKLSVVIPVYNGGQTITRVVENCIKYLSSPLDLEIILVNDGSTDDSEEVCKQLVEMYPNFILFANLAKNVGEHAAVIAGISQTKGEAVAILDDDGQNPPEEVLKLLEEFNIGFDVVYGSPIKRGYSFTRNLFSAFNDKIATILIKKPPHIYLSSFKIISRFLADYIVKHANPNPYLDSLVFQCTNQISQISVNQSERKEGASNYNLRRLFRVWLNMMTTASNLPLRVASLFGLSFAAIGSVVSIYLIIEYLIYGAVVQGYVSLIVGVLVFSGIQLLSLGMIGEYIGRIFQNTQLSTFVIRQIHKKF
jgi:glycosyltransferase involved in cell wall biosynthesis